MTYFWRLVLFIEELLAFQLMNFWFLLGVRGLEYLFCEHIATTWFLFCNLSLAIRIFYWADWFRLRIHLFFEHALAFFLITAFLAIWSIKAYNQTFYSFILALFQAELWLNALLEFLLSIAQTMKFLSSYL